MTLDLTPLLEAIVALATLLITSFLIPWIKTKISAEKLAKLTALATTFVKAADQIYKTVDSNEEKKQYVLDMLAQNGYSVDSDAVNAAVEAAVNTIRTAATGE